MNSRARSIGKLGSGYASIDCTKFDDQPLRFCREMECQIFEDAMVSLIIK